MTLSQLRNQTLQRLNESTSSPAWWTAAMVDAAVNEALMAFVLLTLCLEKTATFTITGGNNFVTPMSTATDWFLPVRVRNAGGAKLYPGVIDDFHAESVDWQAQRAIPRKYAALGCNLLAFFPVEAENSSVSIVYAYSPTRLTGEDHVPAIPEEDHPALSDYALWRCEVKAGGADLASAAARLESFLNQAARRASQVRARNLAQGYDRIPTEISQADISRIIKEATRGFTSSRERRGDPVAALG